MERKFKDVVTGDVMPMEKSRSVFMTLPFRMTEFPFVGVIGYSSLEPDEVNAKLTPEQSAIWHAFEKGTSPDEAMSYFLEVRERQLKEERSVR